MIRARGGPYVAMSAVGGEGMRANVSYPLPRFEPVDHPIQSWWTSESVCKEEESFSRESRYLNPASGGWGELRITCMAVVKVRSQDRSVQFRPRQTPCTLHFRPGQARDSEMASSGHQLAIFETPSRQDFHVRLLRTRPSSLPPSNQTSTTTNPHSAPEPWKSIVQTGCRQSTRPCKLPRNVIQKCAPMRSSLECKAIQPEYESKLMAPVNLSRSRVSSTTALRLERIPQARTSKATSESSRKNLFVSSESPKEILR